MAAIDHRPSVLTAFLGLSRRTHSGRNRTHDSQIVRESTPRVQRVRKQCIAVLCGSGTHSA